MAEENLICPLILTTIPTKPGLAYCQKDKCAWFWKQPNLPFKPKRSILRIAQALK